MVYVGGAEPFLVHTEFLSGREKDYPRQVLWYNVLLEHHHRVPVWSVLVLLRPQADGPELTGEYQRELPRRGKNLWFQYDVIRVWQEAPERLLGAGLALLPLVPVADVAADRLSEVLTVLAGRLRDEAGAELKKTLWTATAILMGLRYPREQVEAMIEGVGNMILGIRGIEDSWVYQDIFAKGRAEGVAEGEAKGRVEGEAMGRAEGLVDEAREILLRLGRKTLGQPDEQVLSRIAGIRDLDRLNSMIDRIQEVRTWEDLMTALAEDRSGTGN